MAKTKAVAKAMTAETLRAMNLGDSIPQGKLFPGITDEDCQWEMIEKGKDHWIFVIRFMGALIGSMEAKDTNGTLTFKEAN